MQQQQEQQHPHDGGLIEDLNRIAFARRRALGWLAGAVLAGCGGGGSASSGTASSSSSGSGSSGGSTTTTTGACSLIPNETEGPYPGDGSNTAGGSISNALALAGIVRSDIRTSVAPGSATAAGVPLTLTLKLEDTSNSCALLAGYAIYVWHCDAPGRYSLYSSGVTGENYLRGVQVTGADGTVTFTTIFPGCYAGRVPHIHFEVYRNAAQATGYANKLRTSQLAFPLDTCATIYAGASGYGNSSSNLASIKFSSDGVFSDGVTLELATLTGSVAAGYAATLTVGI